MLVLFNFYKYLKSSFLRILSSSRPQIFVFRTFMFVNICQNLSFESLLPNFSRATPTPGPSVDWITCFASRKTARHFQVPILHSASL